MRTITGLFDSQNDAQLAATELMELGVPRDQISIVARDESGKIVHEVGGEEAAAEGAGVGAMGGTVVGGAVGLLVGAGLLAIPGIGPVLAIGPLAAAIGTAAAAVGAGALGAGIGAATGGLMGSLVGAGVPEDHAGHYVEGVRRGGTLLAVNADPALASQVDNVLQRHNVIDIERRASDWRNDQSGSQATAGSQTSDRIYDRPDASSPTVLRDHRDADGGEAWQESSKVGTAAGVMSGAATGAAVGAVGGPVGAVIGGVAGAAVGGGVGAAGDAAGERAAPADEYRGVGDERDRDRDTMVSSHSTRNFDQYRTDFETHYQSMQAGGRPYDYYEPAYRFGYNVDSMRYPGNSWDSVEPNLRQDWERNHPSTWDEFKNAVRYAWEKARGLR